MIRPTQEPALLTGNIEYLVLDSVSGDTTGFVIQQGNLTVSSSLTSNTKYFKDYCQSGEIGRHKGFKIPRLESHEGSIPSSDTKLNGTLERQEISSSFMLYQLIRTLS